MTAKPYLSQVRRHLTCSAASRRRLLDRGRQMVEDFLRETPNADTSALAIAFGEPREFAAQMLATLEPEEVEAARRRKRWLRRGGVLALILALVSLAAVCFVHWRALREIIPEDGYYMIVGSGQALTPEEAEQIHNDPNMIWEGD